MTIDFFSFLKYHGRHQRENDYSLGFCLPRHRLRRAQRVRRSMKEMLIMKTVTVQFGSVDNATSFVKAIEDFNSHFDLIYGQYVVDAKSILGVMTMDIRNKVDLRIMERDNEMDTIMKAITPYIAA